MNQQITGKFIAHKRKEKNLTQEQLAEILNVSGRTCCYSYRVILA